MIYNYAEGKLNENPALAGRYMTDSIKRIPKAIDNTKDLILDFQKKINTYQNELSAGFREKSLINDLKHQIDGLSERLEKVFSKEPELEAQAVVEELVTQYENSRKNKRRNIRL